ncbi:hypothetical protein [Actinoplanes xinjiangensis]|uniref:Uncharacterized protein n=1 Tax=Actinoplanes xinjiangensis TaxID=512350 RepID=A0A316FHE4_9ACTN|nr:hypothetical protein [Actinoplanes xinjiangensis]PWK47522.1 hypothetical protein BC793_107132 [Actinoplanes xinjiangensis]GIF39550.1 hypothetical protein Axi01nite_38610 [Actinoplanes xinjiangensis]
MTDKNPADQPLIMVIGNGDLSARLLTMLLAGERTSRVVLAGRDAAALRLRANLARFTAANLGVVAGVDTAEVDLTDVARTAATLASIRPDIIFMGASLQSWRVITGLPADVFAALDEAQLGPWLPMHLTLNHLLMQAVRESGITATTVNAAFPDAVGPVLKAVGLAPDLGIGNVANIVPALTFAAAAQAGLSPADVRVRLVAQHYFSHFVPRFGTGRPDTYRLSATTVDGDRPVAVEADELFAMLTGQLKRLGGVEGQLLTASSAMSVLAAVAGDTGRLVHAPAPGGLPGGYPVRVGARGVELDLPAGVTVAEAIGVNEAGLLADGIEHIDATTGTVTFAEPEMAIMQRMLGYHCRTMKLSEAADHAAELGARYREFASRHA